MLFVSKILSNLRNILCEKKTVIFDTQKCSLDLFELLHLNHLYSGNP